MYCGSTGDLVRRVFEHREKLVRGFTKKYNINKLVYFELHESMDQAIHREYQIKRWGRQKKNELVRRTNPYFHDLYNEIS